MLKEVVLVQVEGGTPFNAVVEVTVDKLDPANMPLKLAGVFAKLPSANPVDAEIANHALHSDRTGGRSHTIWFHGNRTGYRFTMISGMALDFTAEKL